MADERKRMALEDVARDVIMEADPMGTALDWDAEVSDERPSIYEEVALEALEDWVSAHGGKFDRSNNEGVRDMLAHIMARFDEYGLLLEPSNTEIMEPSRTVPKQDAVTPTERHDPITKVAQKFMALTLGEERPVNVQGPKEKKKVRTFVKITQGEGVHITRQFDTYDMEVQNGVISLWRAGVRTFTAGQVFEAITGRDSTKASPKQLAEVEDSIDRQRAAIVRIKYDEEARGRKLKDDDGRPLKPFVEDYMLNAMKVGVECANGREVSGYVIRSTPPLYVHAAALNQVATYPVALLDTAIAGSNTRTNIAIKGYLLRRIKLANGGNMQKRIKYDTVFENVGMDKPTDKQRQAALKYIRGCMDVWKGQGFVKGWTEYRNGRKAEGVEITF